MLKASCCLLLILVVIMIPLPRLLAIDSLTVTSVSAPLKVPPNSPFAVTVTIQYSFVVSTRIEVEIYDYGVKEFIGSAKSFDQLQGTGQKPYSYSLTSPDYETVWSLSAAAYYGPDYTHGTNDWYKDFNVAVVNAVWAGTTTFVSVTVETSTSVTTTVSTTLVADSRLIAVSGIVSFILGLLVTLFVVQRRIRSQYQKAEVVSTKCTNCGSSNPPGSSYCHECGKPLNATEIDY
jgi:hypothetical protein